MFKTKQLFEGLTFQLQAWEERKRCEWKWYEIQWIIL